MPRRLRLAIIGLGAVLAIVLLAAALAAVSLLYQPVGEQWLERVASAAVSSPGRIVRIRDLRLEWPFVLSAATVTASDGDGPWLTVQQPRIAAHPLALLRRRVAIDQLTAASVEVARLPQQASSSGSALPVSIDLDGMDLPIALAPPVLGEAVNLRLSGNAHLRHQDGGGADLRLTAEGGDEATLSGSIGEDRLDLHGAVQVANLARWQRLAGMPMRGSFSATGAFGGTMEKPQLTLSVAVGNGGIGGVGWETLAGDLQATGKGGIWSLSLGATSDIGSSAVVATLAGEVEPLTGSARVQHLRVAGGGVIVRGFGAVEGWGSGSHLVMRLEAPQLDALPVKLGRVSGAAHVTAFVSGNLLAQRVDALVAVHGDAIATGIRVLDRLLGPAPRGIAQAALWPGGAVRLNAARVEGAGGAASAMGEVNPMPRLWVKAEVGDISVFSPSLRGGATAEGRLVGPWADLSTVGNARSPGFVVGGLPEAVGSAGFDFAHLGGGQVGTVTADLVIQGQSVTGGGRITVAEPLRLDDLWLEANGTRVDGALTVAASGGISGLLRAHADDLGGWAALAGSDLAGSLDATARLDPAGKQSVVLTLKAAGLRVADVQVGQAEGEAQLRGLLATPSGRVSVQGRDVVRQGIAASQMLAWVEGGRSAFRFHLDAVGTRDRPGQLLASGRARLQSGGAGQAELERLRFAYGGQEVRLQQAAVLRWDSARLRLEPSVIDVGSGRLTMRVGGSLPLPPGQGAPAQGGIEANAHLDGDIGRLLDLLPPTGQVLTGPVVADARLSGTLAAPLVNGHASLHGGRYENLDQGTLVTGLDATVTMAGDRIRLEAVGGDGDSGRLRLNGQGSLNDGQWRLAAHASGFHALRRDEIQATVSGDVVAGNDGGEVTLTGKAAVEQAEVDISRLKPVGVPQMQVVEINRRHEAEEEPASRRHHPPLALPVVLDLGVEVRRAFVRGRGLESEWQGTLKVAGTAADPTVTGRLGVVRGEFSLMGQTFRLARDSGIIFTGGNAQDPQLDITAEVHTSDVVAQALVKGTASKPEIDFTSDPPLPRDEVISRVLFGKGTGTLSAFQQIELARLAASGLAGDEGGGFDPLGEARSFLGLDVLDVGSSTPTKVGETPGPTLNAGKYIGASTFLRVEQGTSGLGQVTVEEELGRGFSVQTGIGQTSGGGLGLNWRRDY
jgi:translocation and assembly module TamB